MKIKYNWINYNLKRNKEANKINLFNQTNKINFLEKGVYQNIRDIYALALLIANNQRKKISILDYGGNLMSHVNLKNKIQTKNITFFILNPYTPKNVQDKVGMKIKYIKNLNKTKIKKFDLVYFGSVLQYIKNFNLIKNSIIQTSSYILITHTPITLKSRSFVTDQKNAKNLKQNIHTLSQIKKILLQNNFKLIFKSINDYKYSGLKKKFSETFSLNLLFKKK